MMFMSLIISEHVQCSWKEKGYGEWIVAHERIFDLSS